MGKSSHFLGAGSGASGVCKTKWMNIPCAKKEFHHLEAEVLFLKEAGILAHLNHPCIVSFFCCGNGHERGNRFIAMELMEKSLAKLIEDQKNAHFPIPLVIDLMVQMARGMCYLHDRGVAHRDLKPHNVVVNTLTYSHLGDSNHFSLKVVDFGMSKAKAEASKSATMSAFDIGTTRYKAPEVYSKAHLDGKGKGKATWLKADVFSFAMTCAHLLSLETPFKNTRNSQVYNELKNGQRPQLSSKHCPKELIQLLEDCWNISPSLRPSFIEICTRLVTFQHKLLQGFSSFDYQGLEEVKFMEGFDFIKDMIKVHSMIQKPSIMDDNIDEVEVLDLAKADEVEDFNDIERNHLVSVILCTCGRLLKLLPHAPYSSYRFDCNICNKNGHGELYHCEACRFDAHRDCAEIKDKVNVFFHGDPLHLLVQYYYDNNPEVICDFCEESLQGSRWVYNCKQCNFNVHALCTKHPRKMDSIYHSHLLTLVQSPLRKNIATSCPCCNGEYKGYRYTCTQKRCSFDLHPFCMILPATPLCIFDCSHRLYLDDCYDPSRDFRCGRCGTEGCVSWFYRCEHCHVDIHLDCVHDMEEEEDDWNVAYDQFMLDCKNNANHNEMNMIEELLNKLLMRTGLETSSSSSSRPLRVITRMQPKIVDRLTSSEAHCSNVFNEVRLQRKIGTKAKKMVMKRPTQTVSARLMVEQGVKLKNLENILEDLQGSKIDAEVVTKLHKNLWKLRDFVQGMIASKIRQVPRAGLLFSYDWSRYLDDSNNSGRVPDQGLGTFKLLSPTHLRDQCNPVHVAYLILLCEEPNHEHIVKLEKRIAISVSHIRKGERELLEKLQPILASGLQVVRMALSRKIHDITSLDSVTLPILGQKPWDLQAIDLDDKHHDIQTKLAFQEGVDHQNVELDDQKLLMAEDAAAIALQSYLEDNEIRISDTFGLLRVRYIETDQSEVCPRYKQGTVAWLCPEHGDCGLEAGILEPYPLRIYHNLEYDLQREFL